VQKTLWVIFVVIFIIGASGSFWGGYTIAKGKGDRALSESRSALNSIKAGLELVIQGNRADKEAALRDADERYAEIQRIIEATGREGSIVQSADDKIREAIEIGRDLRSTLQASGE
jgi:hypothetical protein